MILVTREIYVGRLKANMGEFNTLYSNIRKMIKIFRNLHSHGTCPWRRSFVGDLLWNKGYWL